MDIADKISCVFFFTLFFINGGSSTNFTIVNHCSSRIFPGLEAGTSPLPITGFSLNSSESRLISLPTAWSGRLRIWARTHCHQNSTTGKFICLTGDCSSQLECSGGGSNHPATVAEFTLNSKGNLDFYNVSLVKGFNVPMTIVPNGEATGVSNCKAASCEADLNGMCPEELKLKVTVEEIGDMTVACKNACEEFGAWEDCCSIEFSSADTCQPSEYSGFFKEACPMGYSYAHDDETSSFSCSDSDYTITFCPKPSVKKTPISNSPTRGG